MKIDHNELIFPIPISDGDVITIRNLPENLKKDDAIKICRVIMALAKLEMEKINA